MLRKIIKFPKMKVLFIVSVTALFFACREQGNKEESRPNILFILTDDQKWNTIHSLDNPYIHTPHLDKLAEEAFIFLNINP